MSCDGFGVYHACHSTKVGLNGGIYSGGPIGGCSQWDECLGLSRPIISPTL